MTDTQTTAELWQGSQVERLVGATATLTNTRTGTVIKGTVTDAKVKVIDKDSPLYVEGMTYVESVSVSGISRTLDLATPFVSDYALTAFDHWTITLA